MSIAKLWASEDSRSSSAIKRAQWAAALSLPFVFPQDGFQGGDALHNPNDSLAARGIINVVGKLRSTIFTGDGWFELDVDPEYKYTAKKEKRYASMAQDLYVESLKIRAALEASSLDKKYRTSSGFFARTTQSLTQLVVTGSTLEGIGLRGNDDFTKRVFRRDQYRTRRDGYGDVLYHVIKESVTVDELGQDVLAKIGPQDKDKPLDLFTSYRRQRDGTWLLQQEVADVIVHEVTHDTPRIFQTDFKRAGGDDYGRGLLELYAGDFTSNDFFAGRMKDWAEAASKFNFLLDRLSQLTPEDLKVPSGRIIPNARVEGGQATDIAILKVDKIADFGVVSQVWERLQMSLAKTMLLDADAAPSGEAGRHSTAWKQTAEQLQGWLGDFYATIVDEQQKPLLWAAIDMGTRTGLLDKGKLVWAEVVSLTGLEAIDKKRRAEAALQLAQLAGSLGPEAARQINVGVLLSLAARTLGVAEPGLVKTPEQLEQEAHRAMADQVKVDAAKAVAQEAARAASGIAQQQAAPAAA